MKRRRSILALAFGGLAKAALGCSSEPGDAAPTSSAPPLGPAEIPADLLGVCVVEAPGALFDLVRKAYDLPIVGSSWAALATNALGLPITASEAFDTSAALRIAVLPRQTEPVAIALDAVLALPLRAPDRLIATATLGQSALFRIEKDEALRGERLVPTGAPRDFVLALVRNHLLVGAASAVARAGGFLADPEQSMFAARSGQIAGWLHGDAPRRLIARELARIDKQTATLLERELPTLSGLASGLGKIPELPFTISVDDKVVSLSLSAPKTTELAAILVAFTGGEVTPLLAIDRDAELGVALNEALPDRVKSAEALAKLLGPMGLASDPPDGVRDALVALAHARADGFQIAVERGPLGTLAYGSCELADEDGARRALKALTKAAVDSKTRDADIRVNIIDTRLTLIGEAIHLTLDREEPAKDKQSEPSSKRLASVLLRIEGGRLALATGSDTVAALRKALRRRAEEGPASLADLAVVQAAAKPLPARAATYAYFDPARWFDTKRASGDPTKGRSALLASLAVTTERVELTLALEPAALRAFVARLSS